MASARMVGTKAPNGQTKRPYGGRPRKNPPDYKRQVPSAYIWPKIPDGTAALQSCMSFLCNWPDAKSESEQLDSSHWLQIIWNLWRARNKGIAGVSYGRSSLAVIGSPLETIGQRSFGRLGD